jgi:hypothetical protein
MHRPSDHHASSWVAYEFACAQVNDGLFTGAYDGVSGRDFTDMVIARWQQLVHVGVNANSSDAIAPATVAVPAK